MAVFSRCINISAQLQATEVNRINMSIGHASPPLGNSDMAGRQGFNEETCQSIAKDKAYSEPHYDLIRLSSTTMLFVVSHIFLKHCTCCVTDCLNPKP